ncbi:MAG: hypothetical protein IK101_02575 [Oscillospiraceae bacterium]|nr:hypothetical protein [Oscillospiraceae bacterium]
MSDKPEKKKSRGRRAYLDDFRRSASGEYIYTGAYYSRSGGYSRREHLARLWPAGAVLIAAAVARGCIPVAGMAGGTLHSLYVLIPYLCELICAVSVVWALVRLSANPEPLREYVHSATAAILPLRSAFAAAFAAAAFVGEAVFFAIHGAEGLPLIALHAVACAAALLVRRFSKAQQWEKSGKPAPEGDQMM